MLEDGVVHGLREAWLALMNLVMEGEVWHVAREHHRQRSDRHPHRLGKEDGRGVVDGQKTPPKEILLRTN
jgi:hypothetical protein